MKLNRFAKFAWGVLAVNLGVILWGAFVRATGSGAGCGSHWPLCNGEVIPRAAQVETLIEFTHRLTSGLALILVIAMFIWAFRRYPKGHPNRLGASLSLFFIITEAAVGAGLVLLELVGYNESLSRAVWMAAHLINTFLLLACLTLTAWWASGGERLKPAWGKPLPWLLALGFLGTLILGVSGALTALGDTLFPVDSVAEGIRQDFSPAAHFLIRLRLLHPTIAIVVSVYLILLAGLTSTRGSEPNNRLFARLLTVLIAIQVGAGLLNVALLAPVWMQIVHLLLADLVWITLVLYAASRLVPEPVNAPQPQPSDRQVTTAG
jgi:heme A synthase